VDAADQAILTAHLGQAGTFGDGDFNYDGAVNAADQTVLDANWHVWLPPQGPLALPATTDADVYSLSRAATELHAFRDPDVQPTYRIPLSAVSAFSFDGGAGNDSLSVLGGIGADAMSFNVASVTFGGLSVAHANVETIRFDGKRGGDALTINGGPIVRAIGTQVLASITVAANATLDLSDNALILDYAGPPQLAAIQGYIASARAGGAWTGSGITSTAARDNPQHNTTLGVMEASEYKAILNNPNATFAGEPIDSTAVLVKYTYYGDATFSGTVNFDDYVRIDIGFNAGLTGWSNGDFNYSGAVDFDDYVLIDIAFNTQGSPLSRGPGAPVALAQRARLRLR
jgi:hypothetical protein